MSSFVLGAAVTLLSSSRGRRLIGSARGVTLEVLDCKGEINEAANVSDIAISGLRSHVLRHSNPI